MFFSFMCYKKIYYKYDDIPNIVYLGYSGMLITYNKINILINPWFDSAFLNSWFPYLYNRFLKDEVLGEKIDYVWISHAHEDHFIFELSYI